MKIKVGDIAYLDKICYAEAQCFPEGEAAVKEAFKKRLEIYPNYFLLMFDGEKLAGFINGMVTDEYHLKDEMYENAELHNERGKWQMIFGVDTVPEYRRQGIAGKLIKKFIEKAKEEGRKGVVLTCKKELISYYSKFGFVNEGISKSVHGGAVWYEMRIVF